MNDLFENNVCLDFDDENFDNENDDFETDCINDENDKIDKIDELNFDD